MGKQSKVPLHKSHGITVTESHHVPKGKGKERLWVHIRQEKDEKWRVYETLAYARGVDIQFVRDKEKQN